MAEKVAMVEETKEAFGIALSARVLGLSRSTWYYRTTKHQSYEEKYQHLADPLEDIARKHSGYGYRRTKPELDEAMGYPVNHKVIRRLHGLWDLSLLRSIRRPKPGGVREAIEAAGDRVNLLLAMDESEIQPFQVVYTDFSEVVYRNGEAKAWLIAFLGHRTKKVFGWAAGEHADTALALEAWKEAKRGLVEWGGPLDGTIIHHDQDPVFTSYDWVDRLLRKDLVQLSYALRGASDNPEMESFFGRFKVENQSLLSDAGTLEELRAVLAGRIRYYNRERRHSSLENRAPKTFIRSLTPRG